MVVDLQCFSVVRSLTSSYAFLLLMFLRHARGVQMKFSCHKIQITCSKIKTLINWTSFSTDLSFGQWSVVAVIGSCKWNDSVADPKSVRGMLLEPPLRSNYFISIGNFEKSWVNWSYRNALSKSEVPNPTIWIRLLSFKFLLLNVLMRRRLLLLKVWLTWM